MNFLFIYRKSYLDIEDLKRCNQLLNQHFSEDELEGLLELAGKSDGKITFENFTEFLNTNFLNIYLDAYTHLYDYI